VIPIAGFDAIERLFAQERPTWSDLPTASTKHTPCHEPTTALCGMPLGVVSPAADVVVLCSDCATLQFCRAASCPRRRGQA
jgi:hypothetical protein